MEIHLTEQDIISLAADFTAFQSGGTFYQNGSVTDIQYQENEQGGIEIKATVIENNFTFQTALMLREDKTLAYRKCNCTVNSIWRGCCKHAVATMIAFQKMSTGEEEFQRSADIAKHLVAEFEQFAMQDINKAFDVIDNSDAVVLAPILYIEKHKPYLNFTLGREKQYLIKDIEQFLHDIECENEVTYGKNLQFVHQSSAFDEQSLELIRWLKIYKPNTARSFHNPLSKNFPVTEKALDDFFELYEGDFVHLVVDEKKYEVLFLDEKPDIQFDVESIDEGIRLRYKGSYYITLSGYKHSYLFGKDGLFRVNDAFFKPISMILEAIKRSPKNGMIFTEDQMKKFFFFLLPQLKELQVVNDCAALELEYAEEPLVTKIHLDAEKNMLFLQVQFCYGNNAFTPFMESQDDIRMVIAEYTIIKLLQKWGFRKNAELFRFELFDEERIYDFYDEGLAELRKYAELYSSERFTQKWIATEQKTKFAVRLTGNLLEVSFDTSTFNTKELLSIMHSYRQQKRYHKLKDGRFYNLQDSEMISPLEILTNLNLSDKDIVHSSVLLPKYRTLYVDNLLRETGIDYSQDEAFEALANDFKHFEDLSFDMPDTLEPVLRTYQKTGFNWLNVLANYGFGGILADDMGLGKTLQMIAVLLSEKTKRTYPSIVIAPTSLVYNWQNELTKFAGELNVELIVGNPAKRKMILEEMEHNTVDVYITTYDTLKRDIGQYAERIFRYIIADEAQNIKNASTLNSKAVKRLVGEIRIALTGTPIENSISELWSIFDFILPGYLHSHHKFMKHYEVPIVRNADKQKMHALKKQIAPFILRRLKKEVLTELPDKIETTLFADMFEEQRKIYTAHLLEARGEFEGYIQDDTYKSNQVKILSLLTRMRQICCDPSLFIENYNKGSGKLELAMETIQTAIESNHRILLFSQFTTMLAIIKARLEEENISYFYLDGSTAAKERVEMTECFNQGEKDVFLISLKAGGTGLNLTGADMVIHYDPWWNPAVMEQASDRAYRFGQLNKVQVYNLVAKDTIEEKIMRLQEKKRDLVDHVITEGAGFLSKMSKEDIVELFRSAE